MTLDAQIINDLHAGQSTAHSIAGRLKRSTDGIMAQLIRMEKEGRVTRRAICDGSLTVWNPAKAQKENAERIHSGAGLPNQPETPTPLDGASC